jgi:hypothetical protein
VASFFSSRELRDDLTQSLGFAFVQFRRLQSQSARLRFASSKLLDRGFDVCAKLRAAPTS